MSTFKITKYQVKTEKCSGRIRFAFLSDLHNKEFGKNYGQLLTAIRAEKPDVILIGGDMIVAKPGASLEKGLELVEKLSLEYPVYYAPGNHEYRLKLYPEVYGDMYQRFRRKISQCAVTFLEGQEAVVEVKGNPVRILGFNMDRSYYHRFYRGELPVRELEKQFGRIDDSQISILMAHHPGYRKTYESYGADLTLSGHFHGGVVGLGAHRGLVTPNFRMFHECCRGRFDFGGGRCQIISAGLGEHTIPVRINNPRELIIIDLVGEE